MSNPSLAAASITVRIRKPAKHTFELGAASPVVYSGFTMPRYRALMMRPHRFGAKQRLRRMCESVELSDESVVLSGNLLARSILASEEPTIVRGD